MALSILRNPRGLLALSSGAGVHIGCGMRRGRNAHGCTDGNTAADCHNGAGNRRAHSN